MSAQRGWTKGPWRTQDGFLTVYAMEDSTTNAVASVCRAGRDGGSAVTLEQAKANARLIASSPALYDALEAVHDWRGLCDEGSLETFERIAAMFHKDTGMLRPGKDQAAAFGGYPTDEERRTAWDAWVKRKNDELDAKIRTALAAARGEA